MQTAINYQDMSAVEALWTLYQQQSERVRKAFRSRIAQEETEEMPCISEAEAKVLTLQRGRDIKAGRSKLIAHDTVMHEMEQMISNYGN
ncbi:MAG: hypothetical protein J6X32_00270 [Salinivirgaceae bacterium]|nr:hypothetical protein [Salinivirgaceae bacterium]